MNKKPAILLEQLCKSYTIHERDSTQHLSLQNLLKRTVKHIQAVDSISFRVDSGEVVGLLGPNGAGKTTTLKMLAGVLYPTAGEADVLGYVPWKREKTYLRQIAMVMGQRNQLNWDVSPMVSFELNRAIYQVDPSNYRKLLGEITELLELQPLLDKPVRNLSLGERMKCEIAVSLLHCPKVLFLDEPTIGLDIPMQHRIRTFLQEYNRRFDATILLTSHYLTDVEVLCRRVIIINQGHLLFDGDLNTLVKQYSPYKIFVIQFDTPPTDLEQFKTFGEVVSAGTSEVTLHISQADAARVSERLLTHFTVASLQVNDPPLDEVITHIFSGRADEQPVGNL